jgi:hypothetical protein
MVHLSDAPKRVILYAALIRSGKTACRERRKGMRRITLLLALMATALVVASGVALAATLNGTNRADTLVGTPKIDSINGFGGGDTLRGKGSADNLRGFTGSDDLYGGPGHDRIISGICSRHRVFAGDGEQDLICVDPNSNGVIETADPEDTFIFNRSC